MPDKVDVPFRALPSFNCAAIILSYVDYDIEVKDLLLNLSKNTGNYYVNHRTVLDGFLSRTPPLIKQKPFGKSEFAPEVEEHLVDFEFPTRDEQLAMPHRGDEGVVEQIILEPGPMLYRAIGVKLKNGWSKNFRPKYGGINK